MRIVWEKCKRICLEPVGFLSVKGRSNKHEHVKWILNYDYGHCGSCTFSRCGVWGVFGILDPGFRTRQYIPLATAAGFYVPVDVLLAAVLSASLIMTVICRVARSTVVCCLLVTQFQFEFRFRFRLTGRMRNLHLWLQLKTQKFNTSGGKWRFWS